MSRYPQTVLVSCECPWDDRDRLLEDVFRREVQLTLEAGYRHVYVFGTAGEGYALDTADFRRVCELFREETDRPDVRAMVGVIGLSTATIVERLWIAHTLGFREFQISLPRWNVLTDKELGIFFRDVCGAFPDSLFLHYNTLKAGRVLGASHYRGFIEDVPNLVATKSMTSDLGIIAGLVSGTPEIQHFLSESALAAGALYGECSLLATYGALAPRKTWALFEAARDGRFVEAAALGRWFERLGEEVVGPLLIDLRVDGTYDKLLVKLGPMPEFPLRMLSPYRWLSDEEYNWAKRTLAERFPDCA